MWGKQQLFSYHQIFKRGVGEAVYGMIDIQAHCNIAWYLIDKSLLDWSFKIINEAFFKLAIFKRGQN